MSKEYRSLNLCREKIKECIENYLSIYFEEFLVQDFEDKGGVRKRINLKIPKGKFYIDFHFNSDGTTTIEDFGGSQEYNSIKLEVCKFIKDNCAINDSCDDSWFVVKDVDKKDFDLILEILKDSEYNLNNEIENIDENENRIIYKLTGKYNEKLTITYYNSKKVTLQGKRLLLFNEALSAFTEFLEIEDIPKCYNKLYKVNINKDAVREKAKIYMQS